MRRAVRSAVVALASCAGCIGATLLVTPAAHAQSLETIPLKFRTAEDLLPILQPLVPQGSAITGTGDMLFVRADAATLEHLREAVASLDRAPRQLLITVGQVTNAQGSGTSVRGSGTLGSGDLQVGVNRPPQASTGGQVVVRSGTASDDARNVSSVRALEGYETYVSLGQSRPFTSTTVARRRALPAGRFAVDRVPGRPDWVLRNATHQRRPRDARDFIASTAADRRRAHAPVTTGSVTTTVTGSSANGCKSAVLSMMRQAPDSGIVTWGTRSDLTQYSAWVKVDEVR